MQAKAVKVSVIAVILAGALWIWSNQNAGAKSGICGPRGMGPDYDGSYCDKSCNVDNDCKFTCGCGAINKNETCHDEGIIYDCVNREVKCEKGGCVSGKEKLPVHRG